MGLETEFAPDALLGPLNDVERKNAPAKLYVTGRLEYLERGSRVAVIGTRQPSNEGQRRTSALCEALGQRDFVIVSGLARGVDAIAHRTALSARARTIAVLGTPLDVCYPKSNQELQESIMREHLAVSQFPRGTPVQRKNFPMRNRTMALLTDATVIVEAGDSSGTLHQGWEALRLGRLLFIMESQVQRSDLSWPSEMIRYGAQVLSRDNLESVLDAVPERSRGELTL